MGLYQGSWVVDGQDVPNGYQQLVASDISSAVALTVPAGTRFAVLQAEGDDVRYRDDGVNPTGSVGMIIAVGTPVVYTANPTALKVIRESASSILNVSYYK